MWIGVTQRFRTFYNSLLLTEEQRNDGSKKHRGVRKCLNSHYYGISSETDNSFLIGSWAKGTRVRPPRDVDLYFVLPGSVYHRLENYQGNRQSALLQEVKNVLGTTYPSTTMRGDGQVVVVGFNTINIEVVPVFELDSGQYWVCDTHDGGTYVVADPKAERTHISTVHSSNNNNLRPIIRMLKAWQAHCNVPLKSFHIELIAAEFIAQSAWRQNDWFYYDWIMRDFLKFLYWKANTFVYVPGTTEPIYLGDGWKSRCESAYGRASKACEFEHDDYVALAGEEWQKIFGKQIPISV